MRQIILSIPIAAVGTDTDGKKRQRRGEHTYYDKDRVDYTFHKPPPLSLRLRMLFLFVYTDGFLHVNYLFFHLACRISIKVRPGRNINNIFAKRA